METEKNIVFMQYGKYFLPSRTVTNQRLKDSALSLTSFSFKVHEHAITLFARFLKGNFNLTSAKFCLLQANMALKIGFGVFFFRESWTKQNLIKNTW